MQRDHGAGIHRRVAQYDVMGIFCMVFLIYLLFYQKMQQKVFMLLALLFLTVQDTMQVESLKTIMNSSSSMNEFLNNRTADHHHIAIEKPNVLRALCTKVTYYFPRGTGPGPGTGSSVLDHNNSTSKLIVFDQSSLRKEVTDGDIYVQKDGPSSRFLIANHGRRVIVDVNPIDNNKLAVQLLEKETLDSGTPNRFDKKVNNYVENVFSVEPFTALHDKNYYIKFHFEIRNRTQHKTIIEVKHFVLDDDPAPLGIFEDCIEALLVISATLEQRAWYENALFYILSAAFAFIVGWIIKVRYGKRIEVEVNLHTKDELDLAHMAIGAQSSEAIGHIDPIVGIGLGLEGIVGKSREITNHNEDAIGGGVHDMLTKAFDSRMQPILHDMREAVVSALTELRTKPEPNIAPLLATVREFTAQIAHLDQPTLDRISHAIDASIHKAIHILHRVIQSHSTHETTRSPA